MYRKISVNIITLGCSKNTVDSEFLGGSLASRRLNVVHNGPPGKYNWVIVNTCGFIHDAKTESVNEILTWGEFKKQGLVQKLVVSGCLSERYLSDLKESIPEADYFFGVKDHAAVVSTICGYKEDAHARLLSTPAHFAYLKIAEGCNRSCAFCAIPSIRGKFISRNQESLIRETEQLVASGVKEIILIAQELNSYGKDLQKKNNLTSLVQALSNINELEWIRLHYAYPDQLPAGLADLIAQNSKVCRYFDVPVQHISNSVLTRMQRKTSSEQIRKILYGLRESVPGIALRTSLLVGFPGETEEEFEELCDFVSEFRFHRLGVFTYSHEEGTPAARKYKDDVPASVKNERASRIMDIQMDISHEINLACIGSVMDVIIDSKEQGFFSGRTRHDSPEVDNDVRVFARYLSVGEIYQVRITDAGPYHLDGVLA
jgi:ribosomal protein S12 methylthiotransferase